MTDIHDFRTRMRDDPGYQPAPDDDGGGSVVKTAIFATCGILLGFGLVLFASRLYGGGSYGVAEMRVLSEARSSAGERSMLPAALPSPAPRLGEAAKYAGKTADEVGKIADDVCFQYAQSQQPHWSKGPRLSAEKVGDFVNRESMAHVNEQLHCLLTEAPARYCSANQRRMITAEITMYFRGIEFANRSLAAARAATAPSSKDVATDAQPLSLQVEPDPRVVADVEGLIRAGYVTKVQRDDIGATVPKPIRDRFARVVAMNSPCPQQPWWAIWR